MDLSIVTPRVLSTTPSMIDPPLPRDLWNIVIDYISGRRNWKREFSLVIVMLKQFLPEDIAIYRRSYRQSPFFRCSTYELISAYNFAWNYDYEMVLPCVAPALVRASRKKTMVEIFGNHEYHRYHSRYDD